MQIRKPEAPDPGNVITSDFLKSLAEATGLATGLGGSAPLGVQSTAAGPLLRYSGPIFGAYVGVTAATISARSGSQLGSGTVKIQTISNTGVTADLAHSGTPITVTAYNISSSTNTIAGGKYVILLKLSGLYLIITAEC